MTEKYFILKGRTVAQLLDAEDRLLTEHSDAKPAFKRYFLSSAQQMKEFPAGDGAVSYIVQPPLDGSAAGVWLCLVEDASVKYSKGVSLVYDDDSCCLYAFGLTAPGGDAYTQTSALFEHYESFLSSGKLNIAENCVRTWLLVRDIDNNYASVVKGRRENFDRNGLTVDTHYIASTGIQGAPVEADRYLVMDSWAVTGKFSQQYLYAAGNMNRTSDYGVTFERGVALDYSEMRHTVISGTASINDKGEVVHIGDVVRQTQRMLENVEALLTEAACTWADVPCALVYLRNAEDYLAVEEIFRERFPQMQHILLLAPVCRPAWLIEMECIALRPAQ